MCLNCVDSCPVKDTLEVKTRFTGKRISKKYIAIGVLAIYFIIIGIGIITGKWNNTITAKEYKEHYKIINMLGHIRSTADVEELNKKAEPQK